ncbi:MAG: DUF2304 family protein [Nanoarchaeota archaeon]
MVFVTLQVIAVMFAIFAWSRVIFRFKDHKMNISALFLWSAVWVGVIVAVLMPETSRTLSLVLGISRPVDVLVYGSIVMLFYMVFRLYILVEGIGHDTPRLVRAIAVLNPRKAKR